MKKLILIFVILLAGCSNGKPVQPDTPFNTAFLMKRTIDSQNYNAFQSLFNEGSEDNVSKETFQQFGEITTAAANHKTFQLLTFSNGEMLLVELGIQLEDEDEYKIVNVTKVPKEMKELFEKSTDK